MVILKGHGNYPELHSQNAVLHGSESLLQIT